MHVVAAEVECGVGELEVFLSGLAAQARLAEKVLGGGAVFVPKSVLLELEWVLRSVAEQRGPSC